MNLSQFDLNQLLALDALLEEKSVSHAARRMYLTPSAMSRALRRLQESFDDKLLVPINGRKMVLTPMAEKLRNPVRQILLQVKGIRAHRPNFEPALARRTIVLCASDYIVTTLLRAVIRRLASEAPAVKLHVVQNNSLWADQLERGDVDLTVIPKTYALPNYPKDTLFSDPYCCISLSLIHI